MKQLLYCIAHVSQSAITLPEPISARTVGDLAVFVAPFPEANPQTPLGFHQALNIIMQSVDILPFRFPTVLPEEQIAQEIERNRTKYLCALERISGHLQMELLLRPSASTPSASAATSGTAYLRRKADEHSFLRARTHDLEHALNGVASEFAVIQRLNETRLAALVRRADLEAFRKFASQQSEVERVTGPWPPTAFFTI